MSSLRHACVLIILNDPVSYWCDYAVQTIKFLTRDNTVVVFCSENTFSWKDILVHRVHEPLFERKWNALLYHPFFIIPGQRFQLVKLANYSINALFLSVYLFFTEQKKKKIFWFFDPFYITSILPFFSGYISVYDCVDYYHGVSKELLKQGEMLVRRATYVFVNSFVLKRKLRSLRPSITVVPLGFARDLFQSKGGLQHTSRRSPVIGFVGGITQRIDYPLLTAVANALPEIQFVFYGAAGRDAWTERTQLRPDIAAFFQLPNVVWKGSIPKREIPRVISTFDICIIPYSVRQLFNRYCFPMKVMEYFYLGKPVISTSIEELKRFEGLIQIGDTAKQWVRFIRIRITTPYPKAYVHRQRQIAEENSWDRKITKMMEVIN